MTNSKTTKGALLASGISLLLCFAMLLGTTFAWFTDSVTSAGNVIQAGTLDVDLVDSAGNSMAGKVINFVVAGGNGDSSKILWEPGCTFETEPVFVKNKGNLALKYEIAINGISGDAKLLEAIEWTVTVGGVKTALADLKGTLLPGDDDVSKSAPIVLSGHMKEEAGNEYQDLSASGISIAVVATQLEAEEDSFDNSYDADAEYPVASIAELQEAINNAEDGDILSFTTDIVGDITIPQNSDVDFTINGNGNEFDGTILVDGKSATYTTAGVNIRNVKFTADSISADACIQLGKSMDNNTRYTCNVTIEGCTFDVPGAVGVKSYTGGDKNLTIRNCTATEKAHSLAQLKGIDGVLVENCKVYSKNGINFNNSDNVSVDGCTVDVNGYAVRFGESSGGTGAAETYLIKDCSLKSANDDGDATIILRGTADNSTLTIQNTTISGTPDIANTATNATVVK